MSSFQERFKGKSSTISKEGLISSLDKPPVARGYIAKEYPQSHSSMSNRVSSTPPTDEANSTQNTHTRFSANAFTNSHYANLEATNNSLNSVTREHQNKQPLNHQEGSALRPSQQGNVQQLKSQQSSRSQAIVQDKKVPLPLGSGSNRQKLTATTNSVKNGSNNNNNNNMQQQQQQLHPHQQHVQQGRNNQNNSKPVHNSNLDPYLSSNPFSLDSFQPMNQMSHQLGMRRNSNSEVRQPNHFEYSQSVEFLGKQEAQQHSGVLKNGRRSPIDHPKHSLDSFYSGFENNNSNNNNPKSLRQHQQMQLPQHLQAQMNSTDLKLNSSSSSSNNPYASYNPYTLDAIQLSNEKKLKLNSKENSQSNFNEIANRNQFEQEEKEAQEFVQQYIPSFGSQDLSTVKMKPVGQSAIDLNALLPQRGGLGANIGTDEWNAKKERQDKMLDYAAQVKLFNQQVLPPSNVRRPKPKEDDVNSSKIKSARERALEFSKNIPKPKQRTAEESNNQQVQAGDRSPKQSAGSSITTNSESGPNRFPTRRTSKQGQKTQHNLDSSSEIDALERQHLDFLNKIQSLNINQ